MRNLVETRAAPGLDADQWYEIGYDALITTAVMTAALVPALVLERGAHARRTRAARRTY